MIRCRVAMALAFACLGISARAAEPPAGRWPGKPFRDLRSQQTEYAGPGREAPPAADVKEVLIGYFAPGDPAHPDAGALWQAAQLAVEQANQAGGLQGRPFRLVAAWSESPWTAGVAELARLVYREKVWAILGGIDGPSTHLAEQVVAKGRLVLVSPVSTDKTSNLTNVPWMFSCAPGDHLQAPLLATEIAGRSAPRGFAVVSADDHDSRLFAAELGKEFSRRRMVPLLKFELTQSMAEGAIRSTAGQPADTAQPPLPPRDRAADAAVARVTAARPSAVVIVAPAERSARLVTLLRGQGFAGDVLGGPWMGRRRFVVEAGAAAEGVVFPLLWDAPATGQEFLTAFQARFGTPPDYAAAHTYDATRLLLAAIAQGGLNRARIRDAVERLSPWPGATGVVRWDPAGSNTRPALLGTIRDGRVERVGGSR